MTTREAEFTPGEVALMLAHEELMSDIGPHGHSMAAATSKEAKFVADPIPTIDKAARAIRMAERAHAKQWPEDAEKGGLMFSARRVDL